MLELALFFLSTCALDVLASPMWPSNPLQTCPDIAVQKHLRLDEVAGSWRLAYLFLGEENEGIDEDSTCVVLDLLATNSSKMELSLFIDSAREDHVDRTTAQFPAALESPGEWKIYTPLARQGYLTARVIQASSEHLVVTFCGSDFEQELDNDIGGKQTSAEDMPDWRALFTATRRKRSFESEELTQLSQRFAEPSKGDVHLWTAVLVKHNNVSALKFVEYAAVLMKHGFDVTKGELVSFGKCPVTLNYKKIV